QGRQSARRCQSLPDQTERGRTSWSHSGINGFAVACYPDEVCGRDTGMNLSISRRLLLIAAALIAAMTAALAAYLIFSRPVHLRVAVGPQDGIDAAILAAFDRLLESNRASVRLDLVTTAGVHENDLLLGKRDVDLAVVRLDDPLPTTAALIAL